MLRHSKRWTTSLCNTSKHSIEHPCTLANGLRAWFTTSSCALRKALQIGDVYQKAHTFDSKDVDIFTASTGDSNPIHCVPTAARARGLPGCVLPGMLCASLFPAIIGSAFPGALYLSQTLKFRQPAMVAEQLQACVTVQGVSGRRITFRTECFSQDGKLLLDGTALALMPLP